MVDQLQCDSCLENSDAQNAQQVSLATPPKLWQAVKIDTFELEDSQRKGFFALYMDAACKLSSCSCFLEGNPLQRFEPNGATLISHLAKDWMQHFPQCQFFDFRVIKRLARKLADDHPRLTLASCVSLACFSHNNGFKTGGYSPVQWAFGADNEEHGFTTTMPSEIKTFRMSAMNRYLQEQAKDAISVRPAHDSRKTLIWNLEPGSRTFAGAR